MATVGGLSTIGVVFGWGVGSNNEKPTSFTKIDGCISIGSVDMQVDQIDVTPMEAREKEYASGYPDSGGEITTTFNWNDTFIEKWGDLLEAYETAKAQGQQIWFEAWHPSMTNSSFYVVEPGQYGTPEYSVGSALQVSISNTLVKLPDPSAGIKPV